MPVHLVTGSALALAPSREFWAEMACSARVESGGEQPLVGS